jgi:hypothetical protein
MQQETKYTLSNLDNDKYKDYSVLKQETLEEAAKKEYPTSLDTINLNGYDEAKTNRIAFIEGAKWQTKRMYSEEEVEQIFNIGQMIKNYGDYKPLTFKEALEQYKKK